jgi:arginine/lysine/ornithine decarboxylase
MVKREGENIVMAIAAVQPETRPILRAVHPLDQRRAPIVAAMRAHRCAGTVSFSTPGHKGGTGLDPELRALLGPELGGADLWLNTADLAAALGEAEELAAAIWGAARSFFLSNGSSAGNHAFLLATVGPGDEVIVGRDLHQSLLTALILTGAKPIFVTPRLHPELGIGLGVDPGEVAAALASHPSARLVAITSPTYWGVASEVATIAAVAHALDTPLYVDEAWGPHFGFHPSLPASALAQGADGAVTSPHKLLTGLSQAAVLHVRGPRVDAERVATAVAMTRTTSPLLPILASLDACRRQLALDGRGMLERAVSLAETARRRLRAIPGVDVLDAARLGLPERRFDPTRLVIDVHGLGLTGIAAERILRERFAIAPEMSDLRGLVCLVTPADTPQCIDRLVAAMSAIASERRPRLLPVSLPLRSAVAAIAPGARALTPREAYFASSRTVPLEDAIGEVAAEPVVPYPPGIPVLTPGEVVSAEKVAYLRAVVAAGLHVRGPADPALRTLRVVAG